MFNKRPRLNVEESLSIAAAMQKQTLVEKIELLKQIVTPAYSEYLGTYDYDAIAEGVLKAIPRLEQQLKDRRSHED